MSLTHTSLQSLIDSIKEIDLLLDDYPSNWTISDDAEYDLKHIQSMLDDLRLSLENCWDEDQDDDSFDGPDLQDHAMVEWDMLSCERDALKEQNEQLHRIVEYTLENLKLQSPDISGILKHIEWAMFGLVKIHD